MSKIIKITNESIMASLIGVTRQYLVGNLKQAQSLTFIKDNDLEIGLSKYDVFTIEPPHKHNIAKEFQLVIKGNTEYIDVDTNETYKFNEGDFYMIDKDTPYAQKASSGTLILFIKVPSINDKIAVSSNCEVDEWYTKKI